MPHLCKIHNFGLAIHYLTIYHNLNYFGVFKEEEEYIC